MRPILQARRAPAATLTAIALLFAATAATAGNTATADAAPWDSLYDWPASHGYAGWSWQTVAGGPAGTYTTSAGLPGSPGLWIAPNGGDYAPGGAAWTYDAPGTTKIQTARIKLSFPNRVMSHHCVRVALTASGEDLAATLDCKPREPVDGTTTLDLTVDDPAARSTQVRAELVVPCDKKNAAACVKNIPQAPPAKNGLRVERVALKLTDPDAPSVQASGPFPDLDGQYINGRDRYGVRLAAQDAGAGVAEVALERASNPDIDARRAPCDFTHHTPVLGARVCPPGFGFDTEVDTNALPEGRSEFRARATDVAGQTTRTDPWSVIVDRTPPTDAHEFEASFDPEEAVTYLDWLGGSDPALADGTPGSGVALERVRYIKPDGTPSDWLDTSDEVSVSGFILGDDVTFETYAVDRVGNQSRLVRETVPVELVTSMTEDYESVFAPTRLESAFFSTSLASPGMKTSAMTASRRRKCAMSGIEPRLTDRGAESKVNVYAFGNYGCPVGDWRFQYMRVEACLEYKGNDGDWHRLGKCAVDRSETPQPPIYAIKNELCAPGTHDYRVKLHAKTALRFARDPHVRKNLYADDLDCNEDGAWRVTATEGISSTSGLLGRNLRDADDDPPASKGFAAHHIVPASYASRAAEAQEYAYSCSIEPNSEINGVWLRGPTLREGTDAYDRLPADGKRRAYHPAIHTIKHFNYIANELQKSIGTNRSCDRPEARATLRSIKIELQYGVVRGGSPPDDDPVQPDD